MLSASGGGRLVVLAQSGVDRVDWETTLDADSAIADAWASQQPQVANRSQARSRRPVTCPRWSYRWWRAYARSAWSPSRRTGPARTRPPVGQPGHRPWPAPAALRLEAALLFDEVRSLATNEERQRLAREIHDGVAQELVMVGYGIDNALATLPDDARPSGRGAAHPARPR